MQWRRHRFLLLYDKVMADIIELLGSNPWLDIRLYHAQHICGQAPGNAHFFDFLGRFDRNTHKFKTAGC
jgi:hypothetical protein